MRLVVRRETGQAAGRRTDGADHRHGNDQQTDDRDAAASQSVGELLPHEGLHVRDGQEISAS